MNTFEGYVGIRLWDGQLVDDMIFSLLLSLLIVFAFVFRSNFRLFVRMLKDTVFIKERQNLFDDSGGKRDSFFRNYMIFQALFLCSIALFAIARIYGKAGHMGGTTLLIVIGILFSILLLFYLLKQWSYFMLGNIFTEPYKYKFWKKNYNAILGTWGVLLYIPVLWLIFIGSHTTIPVLMFCILYLLSRFVIIYKTIRIFHKKSTGFLYISLYLCGQEILPLVFLYEGMVYLYNFIETSTLWH